MRTVRGLADAERDNTQRTKVDRENEFPVHGGGGNRGGADVKGKGTQGAKVDVENEVSVNEDSRNRGVADIKKYAFEDENKTVTKCASWLEDDWNLKINTRNRLRQKKLQSAKYPLLNMEVALYG